MDDQNDLVDTAEEFYPFEINEDDLDRPHQDHLQIKLFRFVIQAS